MPSKLHITGLCAGNSLVTSEFPTQRASNAENCSIWWRHHVIEVPGYWGDQYQESNWSHERHCTWQYTRWHRLFLYKRSVCILMERFLTTNEQVIYLLLWVMPQRTTKVWNYQEIILSFSRKSKDYIYAKREYKGTCQKYFLISENEANKKIRCWHITRCKMYVNIDV